MTSILTVLLVWCSLLTLFALIIWLIITITGSRIHFIEISDMDWCPDLFRECIHNCLHYGWIFFGLSEYFGSPALTLSNIMYPYVQKLKCNLIIDLCSGSGGPTPFIHDILNKRNNQNITTVLTDLFPKISVWKSLSSKSKHLLYSSKSMNAAFIELQKIPEIASLNPSNVHFRTLFGSFHHFKPDLAVSILSNAMECNDAFIMCEAKLRRQTVFDFIQWPTQLFLLAPFFIMYMIKCYLFEYDNATLIQRLIKCILMVLTFPIWYTVLIFDGIISNGRCYTEKELLRMTELAKEKLKQKLSNKDHKLLKNVDNYEWKCWRQPSDMIFPLNYMGPVTVLLGSPISII